MPKLALGAMAAGDAWTIKAHSEAAAAAASDVEVHRATVDISNAHIGPASNFSSSRHKYSWKKYIHMACTCLWLIVSI